MGVPRRFVTLVTILLLFVFVGPLGISGSGLGTASAEQQVEVDTIRGIAVDLDPEMRQDIDGGIADMAAKAGLKTGKNTTAIYTDGGVVFVTTNEPVKTGYVSATGMVVRPEDGDGIMYAEHMQYWGSDTDVSYTQYATSTEDYAFESVAVNAWFTSAPIVLDASDRASYEGGLGGISAQHNRPAIQIEPGRLANTLTVEASGKSNSGSRKEVLAAIITTAAEDQRPVEIAGTTVWAMRGNATVEVGTVMRNRTKYPYLIDYEPESEAKVTVSELSSNPDRYSGNVVTVTGVGASAKISSQEVLSRASGCGDSDAVMIPSVGCLPVPTDATVHAGLVADSTTSSTVVPTIGVSNLHSSQPVAWESGEYEITGRVVSASEVDPRLDFATALVVYDREQRGSVGASELRDRAKVIVDKFRSQIVMNQDEWAATITEANSTPTPTSPETETTEPRQPTDEGTQKPTQTPEEATRGDDVTTPVDSSREDELDQSESGALQVADPPDGLETIVALFGYLSTLVLAVTGAFAFIGLLMNWGINPKSLGLPALLSAGGAIAALLFSATSPLEVAMFGGLAFFVFAWIWLGLDLSYRAYSSLIRT